MNKPLNVIIPMVGIGARFQAAGYQNYKPFIEILGKKMVEWAIAPFPVEVKKHFIVAAQLLTAEHRQFLESIPQASIIEIEKHSLGPAYSIYKALSQLPLEESFFITYCDIFWTWDFNQILPHLHEEGIVFTRRSFHPHLIKNGYSAFCLPEKNQAYLAEIKEKASFTDHWMSEPLSVGAFYVQSGQVMAEALTHMITHQVRVGQEYFPSLLFNRLIEQGRRVLLHDIDFFAHWGTPEQLEDVLYWQRVIKRIEAKPVFLHRDAIFKTLVCCMGGTGSRMKSISLLPKAALPLCGIPMVQFVSQQLGCTVQELILTSHLKTYFFHLPPSFHMTDIGEQTGSQLETLKRAQGLLGAQACFFLTSCDAYGYFDHAAFETFVQTQNPDAVIFTFSPTLTQRKLASHHTHVSVEGSRITAVHIKSKSQETDQGLAGFFWFREGALFKELESIQVPDSQEGSADHVLKYGVETGKRVLAYPLQAYIHLGTQEEYQEFLFWQRYHKALDV